MDVLEAIRERRAVRDYKSEPVTAAELRYLIGAASWAPSAMNEQCWRFTVITKTSLLDQISDSTKRWLLKNLETLPRSSHFRDILSEPDFHIFYHAPALIVISALGPSQWAVEDCSLAAENLMLAATAMGLGSCWIGFAQGWLNTSEARLVLGYGSDNLAVAPIIVGYPKIRAPAVERKLPAIHWINDEPKSSQNLGKVISSNYA